MGPLISVIVPVYNVEKYIGACVKSILEQTYCNLEIILVDDGSKDDSGKICDDWAKRDARIKKVYQENGGLSHARNTGTKLAMGDYIIYVDGDDLIAPNLVKYLYDLILETDADIGICDLLHCYPGKPINFLEESRRCVFDSESAICEMLYQRSFLVSACGKIFPRKVFLENMFPVGILYEDSAVMYKIFDCVDRIVYGDAKLYGYIHHAGSITTKKFTEKDCGILNICEEITTYFKNRSVKLIKAGNAYKVVGALRIYLNAPRTIEFEKYILNAKSIIDKYGKAILKDKECRKKTRYALYLYFYLPFFMNVVYDKVDRWK